MANLPYKHMLGLATNKVEERSKQMKRWKLVVQSVFHFLRTKVKKKKCVNVKKN